MIRKFFLSLILISCSAAPVFALKVIDDYIFTSKTPYKIELRKVQNAECISVKIDKTLTNLRLSNIICNEYSKYNLKTSSTGIPYTLEDMRGIKNNNHATKFLSELLEANENNLFFQQQGAGYYYSVVGELFIGNKSVNKLLVDKGYCRPIE